MFILLLINTDTYKAYGSGLVCDSDKIDSLKMNRLRVRNRLDSIYGLDSPDGGNKIYPVNALKNIMHHTVKKL